MRKLLVTLATCAVALPLQAQLSPEQRAAQQLRIDANAATRDFEARLERLSLSGDQAAYAGPTGRDYRLYGRESWRLRRGATRPLQEAGVGGRIIYIERLDDLRTVRGFIGQRQGRPVRLKPLGATTLDARAGIPLVLTLSSPLGGEGMKLGIRAVVSAPGAEPAWEGTVELEGDDADTYRIEVPPLPAGGYEVYVEVFYPEEPVLMISSTRTPLVVWQP
jgi:hypothetical protein